MKQQANKKLARKPLARKPLARNWAGYLLTDLDLLAKFLTRQGLLDARRKTETLAGLIDQADKLVLERMPQEACNWLSTCRQDDRSLISSDKSLVLEFESVHNKCVVLVCKTNEFVNECKAKAVVGEWSPYGEQDLLVWPFVYQRQNHVWLPNRYGYSFAVPQTVTEIACNSVMAETGSLESRIADCKQALDSHKQMEHKVVRCIAMDRFNLVEEPDVEDPSDFEVGMCAWALRALVQKKCVNVDLVDVSPMPIPASQKKRPRAYFRYKTLTSADEVHKSVVGTAVAAGDHFYWWPV